MLHARLFAETSSFRNKHFQHTRNSAKQDPATESSREEDEELFLDGNPTFDRPLITQFCANDPDELLNAAKHVESYCDAVDLNLGCPQGIARKGNYGAFLQEDQDLIYRLINTLHVNLEIPVTAKMRILDTKEKTLDYAKLIASAGASIITIHGRQREQKGHATGMADWSIIRYVRDHISEEVVIFANGNILQHDDIEKCLSATKVDGVMSAEGNLYDPAIFAQPPPEDSTAEGYWRGKDGKGGWRMDAVLRRYLDIIYKHVLEVPPPTRKPLFNPSNQLNLHESDAEEGSEGEANQERPAKKRKRERTERCTSPNLVSMQAHLFHMLRPLVSKHTHIRDALARSRPGDLGAFENVLGLVEKVTREGLQDYETYPEAYEATQATRDDANINNGNQASSHDSTAEVIMRVQRPWWICQPHVRPSPKEALERGSLQLSKKDKAKLTSSVNEKGRLEALPESEPPVELGEVAGNSQQPTETPEATQVYG
jgi:tRNA-dihydrouridine synthase 1